MPHWRGAALLLLLGLQTSAVALNHRGSILLARRDQLAKQAAEHTTQAPPVPYGSLFLYGLEYHLKQQQQQPSSSLLWRALSWLRSALLRAPPDSVPQDPSQPQPLPCSWNFSTSHPSGLLGPGGGAGGPDQPLAAGEAGGEATSADAGAGAGRQGPGQRGLSGPALRAMGEIHFDEPGGACYDAAADGLAPELAEEAPAPAAAGGAANAGSGRSGGRGAGGRGEEAQERETAAAAGISASAGSASRPPVIFLPPLAGTLLQARLQDKPAAPRWWCPRRTSNWFLLWLPAQALLPWQFPCFADNLRLVPGSQGAGGGPATPPPGVQIRTGTTLEPQHGDPRGGPGALQPWSTVAARLRRLGWTDELLDSHSYDWRLSPPEWLQPGGSFEALRASIEAKVAASGRRVVLLGLSLGATYGGAFLASGGVGAEWKERHVERFVTISGVFGGTPASPWDVVSGRLQGLERVFDRPAVRQLLHGIPSLAWTFPSPDLFGDQHPVLINRATGRNYTAGQLGQALRDVGAPETASFWAASQPSSPIPAPGVETHCFYSYGLPSAYTISYGTADFSDAEPEVTFGDGDVTAPYASLAVCRGWAASQAAPVFAASYWGVVHAMLTQNGEALADIVDAVAGPGAERAEMGVQAGGLEQGCMRKAGWGAVRGSEGGN